MTKFSPRLWPLQASSSLKRTIGSSKTVTKATTCTSSCTERPVSSFRTRTSLSTDALSESKSKSTMIKAACYWTLTRKLEKFLLSKIHQSTRTFLERSYLSLNQWSASIKKSERARENSTKSKRWSVWNDTKLLKALAMSLWLWKSLDPHLLQYQSQPSAWR